VVACFAFQRAFSAITSARSILKKSPNVLLLISSHKRKGKSQSLVSSQRCARRGQNNQKEVEGKHEH
jgi:hypothetical protein